MKTKIIILMLGILPFLVNSQGTISENPSKIEKGMVKVTILYPNSEGSTFNMDYYSNNHMPMVAELLGDSLKQFEVDKGMAGRTPDEAIPYLAIGYLFFDKLSDYQESFGPVAEKIVSDIPNYTNIQPVIQISEIIQ